MITIGLTGPSGAGKGELSVLFEKHNIPVLDTDKVSRIICGKNMPCTLELAGAFGGNILMPDGSLDRKKLAQTVFANENRESYLPKLNEITHRYILEYADNWLEEKKKEGYVSVVVDAPVLFESGYDKKCDFIIGVLADKNKRIRRITERDNIDTELAQKRINAQKSDRFYKENCSLILYNNEGIEELEKIALPYIMALEKGIIPAF